jgi:multiple sugar transport system permease protein
MSAEEARRRRAAPRRARRSLRVTRVRSTPATSVRPPRIGWAFAAPTAAVVGVLFLLPLALMVWMSLNEWPLVGPHAYNAPGNYTALAHNDLMKQAVLFTLKYTVIVTVLLVVIGLALALLLQESRPGTGLFRTAIFLPSAIGFASASLLFFGLLSPQAGPMTSLLDHLGLAGGPVDFLGTPDGALWSTIALVIWRFAGLEMLLLLVGLNGIPTELYEAARVDGASRLSTFRLVTLPLLRPTLALVLILTVTGSLLAFDQFYVLTKGGPSNSTVTVVMVIYREAFTRFNLGTAAALSTIVLAALLALNMLQFRVIRREA